MEHSVTTLHSPPSANFWRYFVLRNCMPRFASTRNPNIKYNSNYRYGALAQPLFVSTTTTDWTPTRKNKFSSSLWKKINDTGNGWKRNAQNEVSNVVVSMHCLPALTYAGYRGKVKNKFSHIKRNIV